MAKSGFSIHTMPSLKEIDQTKLDLRNQVLEVVFHTNNDRLANNHN